MNMGMNKGVTINHDLRGLAIGKVQMFYKGKQVMPPPGMDKFMVECEVYQVDDHLLVHTVCPKCRHAQNIDSRNKQMDFDRERMMLKIEPFTCPWEMGGEDEHRGFGVGLCQMRVAYDGRVIRDA